MPTKKKTTEVPNKVKKGLEYIAKGMGVAVTELWTMFVQQYLVRGIALGLISIAITGLVMGRYGPFFWEGMLAWFAVPLIVAQVFTFYWAIMYIGNPKYYALNDITEKIGAFVDKVKDAKEVRAEVISAPKISASRTTYR